MGKTRIMKDFRKDCYDSFVYFNFDEEAELKCVFDEIQECPPALNALKYFTIACWKRTTLSHHQRYAGVCRFLDKV